MGFLDRIGLGRATQIEGPEPIWVCGRASTAKVCRAGPSAGGRCQTRFECTPTKSGKSWRCRRPASEGGPCEDGPLAGGTCGKPLEPCQPVKTLRAKREAVSKWIAALTLGVVVLAIAYAADTSLLMPGPITTAHGTLGKCSSCHTNTSDGQFGWLHAVVATADPRKDSEACLTCHKLGDTALTPHGLEIARLEAYTKRLESTPAASELPVEASVRDAVFPTEQAFSDGVFCATCHKEHQGKEMDLTAMSDGRCQTCHAVQFDSFHTDHPKFENYPFRRRTRINFDHSSHFRKHFPEWRSKKAKLEALPGECADCHMIGSQGGHMNVKPFEEVCSSCHLDQIVGVGRSTGPRGIALLTLPGLDVETLKDKRVEIGEWPEEAEGELTPMMKLLIGWDDERRKLLKDVGELDLLDLSEATDEQVAQVGKLAWEVKHLLFALSTARTTDVLKRLGTATGMPVDQELIAKLTANMPRDVLIAAQNEWLPKLGEEIDLARYEEWLKSSVAESTSLPKELAARAAEGGPENPLAEQKKTAQREAALRQAGPWRIDAFGRLIKGNAPPEPEFDSEDETDDDAQTSAAAPSAGVPIDAESWAELGGWYRQDFSVLYQPPGHADPFLKAWLDFTGRLYSKAESNLATPVFEQLTSEDAQGQCTKCHSVDAAIDRGRVMSWMPSSLATRESLFTKFDHEPHFGLVDEKGCLTCHDLSGAKGYQETYKGHDPYLFVSNFKPVEKNMCAECHGNEQAREDCLLCHKYHSKGVATPITATKIPEK